MRPIDADAFSEQYGNYYAEEGPAEGFIGTVGELIAKQPTIEAEPVRHAHWESWGFVYHGIEWKRCSACGKCADVSYYGVLDGEIKMSTPALCGCCGAKMDANEIAERRAAEDDYAEY